MSSPLCLLGRSMKVIWLVLAAIIFLWRRRGAKTSRREAHKRFRWCKKVEVDEDGGSKRVNCIAKLHLTFEWARFANYIFPTFS